MGPTTAIKANLAWALHHFPSHTLCCERLCGQFFGTMTFWHETMSWLSQTCLLVPTAAQSLGLPSEQRQYSPEELISAPDTATYYWTQDDRLKMSTLCRKANLSLLRLEAPLWYLSPSVFRYTQMRKRANGLFLSGESRGWLKMSNSSSTCTETCRQVER